MARPTRHLRDATGAVALLIVMLATTARTASAQALLERFDPAERGSRFFMADSLELEGDLRLATGVITSYGNRLRTFRQSGVDGEASVLVEHSVWIHPGASLVLAPGARLALDLPIALQSGSDVALDGTDFGRPASPRLGDVRASFDLRLFRSRPLDSSDVDGGVVAAGVSAYLPTGSANDYTGDDFTRFDLHAASACRIGHALLAIRAGYMYRKDDLPAFGGVSLGSELNTVLAAGYRTEGLVVGPELHGTTTLKSAFERRNAPLEALLGAHLSVADFRVGAGIGTLLVAGLGAARLRGVVSIEWTPGGAVVPSDRDHDGVLDADDVCPDVPGVASGPPGTRGCPPPPRDSDQDGIIDSEDACPDLPGIRTTDPRTHGCPASPPAPAPADGEDDGGK